jgi:hypothetical protein
MQEIEIPMPRNPDFAQVSGIIEKTVVSSGLQITLKASLGKYPGCTHWHVKNGKDKGILEITIWPKQTRAWFSIQSGRKADWIRPKVTLLQRRLKHALLLVERSKRWSEAGLEVPEKSVSLQKFRV